MKNVVVVSDFEHDTWLEVHFGFLELPEGQELPALTRLAGIE